MKVGLIGLPECGKTSLFNALTRSQASLHMYDSRAAETNMAVVEVPDQRFTEAVRICSPKKQVPATIEVVDGAARVEVHERGRKFGSDFFSGVRSVDALLLVVRDFSTASMPVPDEGLDPARDADTVIQELALADLAVVENRLERLAKNRVAKRLTAADAAEEAVLVRIGRELENAVPVRQMDLTSEELRQIRSFAFVSGKPLIIAHNIGEDDIPEGGPSAAALDAYASHRGLPVIRLCARLEAEIAQMPPDEETQFLAAMGVEESARDVLIRIAYAQLGLISFLTVGPDEVRAWTITKGTTALGAAEKIHTDIARTFIRAEVMAFDDFRTAGGWDAARSAGKMRLEGKDYVVRDGEIVHIRNSKG